MINKLSHSEAGKLGAIVTNQIMHNKKQKRINEYQLNPQLCKKCHKPIPYEKRMNVFCSHSCSASINNLGVRRHGNVVEKPCAKCGKITKNPKYCSRSCSLGDYNRTFYFPRAKSNEVINKNKCLNCGSDTTWKHYCSRKCKAEYSWKKSVKYMEEHGSFLGCKDENNIRRKYKKYLIQIRGHKCEICGFKEWMNKPIDLVLDHMDGNSENWSLINLRIICNNCDAQTSTYKGRNKKGKGRFFRRQRYHNGQSC